MKFLLTSWKPDDPEADIVVEPAELPACLDFRPSRHRKQALSEGQEIGDPFRRHVKRKSSNGGCAIYHCNRHPWQAARYFGLRPGLPN